MGKKRVYCNQCKHYRSKESYIVENIYLCKNKKVNTKITHSWLRAEIDEIKPGEINKNNDCIGFESDGNIYPDKPWLRR